MDDGQVSKELANRIRRRFPKRQLERIDGLRSTKRQTACNRATTGLRHSPVESPKLSAKSRRSDRSFAGQVPSFALMKQEGLRAMVGYGRRPGR